MNTLHRSTMTVCALAAALGVGLPGCQNAAAPAAPVFSGYVEGEYLYLSAPAAGYLQTQDAPRGAHVNAGQPVFAIATDPDAQALAEVQARASAASLKVRNLQTPRRQPELAALQANVDAALAAQRVAQSHWQQQQALAQARFISTAALDDARSRLEQATAQAEAARQQLAASRVPIGRDPEVQAAEAEALAADAQVAQKRWAVARKAVAAPVTGELVETYYQPGEWVPAGAPVASLLPDAGRKLRFFVPESALAQLQTGQAVQAGCDGCAQPIRATIRFIATQAEYTPPVIYSKGSREKLVFRIEALPEPEQATRLRPGLPVDVRLLGR